MLLGRLILPLMLIAGTQLHAQANWHETLVETLPVLGHRNWIVIADPAYPWQSSNSIEVMPTNLSQTDLLTAVLDAISRAPHVRPVFYTDAELPFVPEPDAQGISAYRAELPTILKGVKPISMPHEQMLAKLADAASGYHILVLKSTTALAYTSVYIQLDSGYWSEDAEKRLRSAMGAAGK